MRGPGKKTLLERFWAKVDRDGLIPVHRPDLGPCWLWTAGENGQGYGSFHVRPGLIVGAHCFSYEFFVGPIPDEADDVHHVCEVPACVRPSHLEALTRREHVLVSRKTHCPQGHEYAGDNVRITRRGGRVCRTCHRERERGRRRVAA